jgi:3-dehydroquinate dehydratase-2
VCYRENREGYNDYEEEARERMKILILNGPNLNLLGQREPEIYGSLTLNELNCQLAYFGEELNRKRSGRKERIELYFYQSNHEGILVDTFQNAPHNYDGIVYNPAAHTHYSIALRDAIASIPIPVVEVHLSDINVREGFRSHSVMTDVCIAMFKGMGVISYRDGIELLVSHIDANTKIDELDDDKHNGLLEYERQSGEDNARVEPAVAGAADQDSLT